MADRRAETQLQLAFTQRAFDLLRILNESPTKTTYMPLKDELRKELEVPFQTLFRAIATLLPVAVTDAMECERHVFSKFHKNDWGQGGVWPHYWGALYSKGGKRTEDAQLFVSMHNDRLDFGFATGDYGKEQILRFQRNCYAHRSRLLPILTQGPVGDDVLICNSQDVLISGDGVVTVKNKLTWDEFLTNPRLKDVAVRVVWAPTKVVKTTREELAAEVARIFSRLFPLVLLITQDDPMPAIERYVASLAPLAAPDRQPEYPLSRCAEDTCMDVDLLERWVNAIERKGQAIIYGPPGTGKTYLAQKLAQHVIGGGDGFCDLVQFHPAYAYEDFIQGIRPHSAADGHLEYPVVAGRFLDFCTRAAGCKDRCVLIIDEINRANLARVFGEMMFLLEYRDAEVPLAGGGMLKIPNNVRIIGTMNTADRSIALVDHALRRRFAFLALYPNYDVLKNYHEGRKTGFSADKLIQTLTLLNRTINDRHYEVGISYFLRDDLKAQLEDIWRMEIEPYLDEYFYDDPSKAGDYRWERIAGEIIG